MNSGEFLQNLVCAESMDSNYDKILKCKKYK